MKQVLMSSIVLLTFSTSILLFQISCKKDANAQTSTGGSVSQLNKIVYLSYDNNNDGEIWTVNYNGANQQKLNVILPSGASFDHVRLSPDGQTLLFQTHGNSIVDIYSCNIDGSNVKKIASGNSIGLEGAY